MATFSLANNEISISVQSHGAELCSLKDQQGHELIWQADDTYWPRHAPLLFPIVGRLKNDKLIHQGKSYPLTQHGFARDMVFECIEQEGSYLSFRLCDNEETRKHYPFSFELLVNYALIGSRLLIVYVVRNYHDQDLYFSIGGHPAFNWPLIQNDNPQDYDIRFEQDEPLDIWQLEDGLIHPALRASPVSNKTLKLTPGLFDHDALIFPDINSQRVSFGNDRKRIEIAFEGFPDLGIWSKPNAPFVCIEPWVGHASPLEFHSEFSEKPGVVLLPSFGERSFSYSIETAALPS